MDRFDITTDLEKACTDIWASRREARNGKGHTATKLPAYAFKSRDQLKKIDIVVSDLRALQ